MNVAAAEHGFETACEVELRLHPLLQQDKVLRIIAERRIHLRDDCRRRHFLALGAHRRQPLAPIQTLAEGKLAREHLVEHHAQRPEIGAAVGRLAPGLLGRHVGHRSHHHPGLGEFAADGLQLGGRLFLRLIAGPGIEQLGQQDSDLCRGVELTALLAFGAGELAEEMLAAALPANGLWLLAAGGLVLVISGLAITLFLGGWNAPLSFLTWVPSYIWFFLKLLVLIFVFIWVRGTVPRLRMDQLMNFAWKFMLPMTLINIGVAAIWHYMGPGLPRWIVCVLLVAGLYVALGRGLSENKQISRRTYRFAE